MEETIVIKGLSRQAKMSGLPLPYFMAVVSLTVLPFMITKSLPWILTCVIWYVAARSITAVNPNGHRIVAARLRYLPMAWFTLPVRFARARKGRVIYARS